MGLSSLQLEAFKAVAEELNFSRAAETLGLTQSALSQRIQKLENELETTLFSRGTGGVRLTEEGWRLLHFALNREKLEQELLDDLKGQKELTGTISLVGPDTLIRSVIQPAFKSFLQERSKVEVHLQSLPRQELQNLIYGGNIDFIVLGEVISKEDLETYVLGHETYVRIEPKESTHRRSVYLEPINEQIHSQAFLQTQGQMLANITQSFLDNIDAVIEGVRQGLGSAIVPKHLLSNLDGIKIDESWSEQRIPVVLHFKKRSHYPRLFRAVLEELTKEAPRFLQKK